MRGRCSRKRLGAARAVMPAMANSIGANDRLGDAPLQRPATVRLLLTGDVMGGRGIDQILPHPFDPRPFEPFVRDARDYVRLAERLHGAIARPVDWRWPWGDALVLFRDP